MTTQPHDVTYCRASRFATIARLFVGTLCTIGAGPVRAQNQAPPMDTGDEQTVSDEEFHLALDDPESSEVLSLINDLGSPEYPKREHASLRLLAIGAPAFSKMRTAYRQAEDLETRLRIEQIVRQGYLNYHVYLRNAFLGISQARVPVTHADDSRIAEGHIGVRIAGVLPGTAAQQAGLHQQDVIIAVDGVPVKAGALEPMAAFGDSIRVRRPGARITLLVLRGDQTAEVQATLRPRPESYYNRAGDSVTRMLHQSIADFNIWWVTHFRPR